VFWDESVDPNEMTVPWLSAMKPSSSNASKNRYSRTLKKSLTTKASAPEVSLMQTFESLRYVKLSRCREMAFNILLSSVTMLHIVRLLRSAKSSSTHMPRLNCSSRLSKAAVGSTGSKLMLTIEGPFGGPVRSGPAAQIDTKFSSKITACVFPFPFSFALSLDPGAATTPPSLAQTAVRGQRHLTGACLVMGFERGRKTISRSGRSHGWIQKVSSYCSLPILSTLLWMVCL